MADVQETAATRLGVRADERGRPRVATTVAASGAFVAFTGAITLAFDATEPADGGGVSTTPGTLICLAVVIAGYAVLAVKKQGPLATAGVVAFAIALPFFFGYATFDETGFPPFSVDAIFGLSTLGWGAAYLLGPSRGRPFLLGAALLGAWWFLLEQVTNLFTSPFTLLEAVAQAPFTPGDDPFGSGGEPFGATPPDPTDVAVVCGLIAAAYLVGSHLLERRGRLGVATPMVAIGHAAAIVAIFTVADDLQEIGTGIVALVVGVLLAYRGATTDRRATTWIGGLYVIGGVQAIVTGITDSATTGGILLIGGGLALAVLAAFGATATGEPDDDEPGPSFPDGIRSASRTDSVALAAPGGLTGDAPPGPGYWRASDGNWYAPELHPDARGGPADPSA